MVINYKDADILLYLYIVIAYNYLFSFLYFLKNDYTKLPLMYVTTYQNN